MRIALIHSFYSDGEASGENQIVRQQETLLRDAGHAVEVFSVDSLTMQDEPFYALRTSLKVATGRGINFSSALRSFRPDVVHVHNLFPNIGARWLREVEAPVVATVHNFRLTCANGLLFRNGEICRRCVGNSGASGVRFGCYRGSRLGSLAVVAGTPQFRGTYSGFARIICPSEAVQEVLIESELSEKNLAVLPHAVGVNVAKPSEPGNGRWLAVGRLSPEKGFGTLLASWNPDNGLDIVGSGPLGNELKQVAPSSVSLLGSISRSELLRRMPQYDGLVFPSVCYEVQPTVVIEAMASGLPVVAKDGNAGSSIVTANQCGVTYDESGKQHSSLDDALTIAVSRRRELGANGQRAFEARYSNDVWLNEVNSLYETVIRGE